MIINKESLNKLKEFGLNTYESKLWAALLSRGSSTAGELADISGVPRSRSYDVLESLEKKGFVGVKTGKPIKYLAIPPNKVIEKVKENIKEQTNKQTILMEELKIKGLLDELNQLHSKGLDIIEPSELSGAIKGRINIYNHVETMINNAKKYVYIITTKDNLKRKLKHFNLSILKAKQRGVKIKFLVSYDEESLESLKRQFYSVELKNTTIKNRFLIVDGKEGLLFLLDDVHPSYDVGVWINTKSFIITLENLFNQEWAK
jgi:sugar-specific transcriptional regulator TrmB